MDSLTQIVLGAAVGEAVLGRKVGNKAMLYGAIAGTIPDLDVITRFFLDTVSATEWHRGFSHSIFFSVLFAPLFGWLVWKINKKESATWKEWSWLMFWGFFTHPLLDAFTTWGTQLFWPFKIRLAFQSVFVIDPLYTVPFIVFLILAMFQKRTAVKRRKYVNLGLVISSAYLLLTLVLKGIAFKNFENALDEQGIVYSEMNTRPAPLNTVLWMANIDTEDAYLMGDYSFFDSQPISFASYPKNHKLLGKWTDNDKIIRLIKITEGWYTITEKEGQLYFNDLRFGLISLNKNETEFAFSYKLVPDGDDLFVEERPKFKRDAKRLMAALWQRMWGN
ncbi:inner membrane protein [Maribacter spongiicola]|uniref:Inner membrane protein n=1 Tax=Maribacter spongiicola TaxID=1206753 RepID=A0A4V3ERV6_9FLAO|nr:metal-dependent hydrolase [Maribacter spongiicola]TDT46803.1 inner membrane protein [Maribacter spongiicola]